MHKRTWRSLRSKFVRPGIPSYPIDFDSQLIAMCKKVAPYTMTTPTRIAALRDSVDYIESSAIPGAIVECGVWRGGSMMAIASTLLDRQSKRDLYLFDTFAGMTPPGDSDRRYDDESARNLYP